jgi:hypothetical protein
MSRITFELSMPVAEARSTLSLTARVALPSRVYWSVSATATSTITARTVTMRSRGVMVIGPIFLPTWLV